MRITIVSVKSLFFKMEQSAAIKFCVKLKKTATATFEMLKSTYSEECLLRISVFEWHLRLKEGRKSIQDDERKGRPSTSRREESTENIQKMFGRRPNFECSDVRRSDGDQ
jgi:hypothetical protein